MHMNMNINIYCKQVFTITQRYCLQMSISNVQIFLNIIIVSSQQLTRLILDSNKSYYLRSDEQSKMNQNIVPQVPKQAPENQQKVIVDKHHVPLEHVHDPKHPAHTKEEHNKPKQIFQPAKKQ